MANLSYYAGICVEGLGKECMLKVNYYGRTLLAEDNIQWEAFVIAMMTLQDLN